MSILDDVYKHKIQDIKKNKNISSDYFYKIKLLKNHLDDFRLINFNDDFFTSVYKKNFDDILDFEIKNNFKYSTKDIKGIENKIKKLAIIDIKKYSKTLDYMILKTSDIDSPLYGTVINFIFLVFDDINNTLELSLKINKIWEQEYSNTFSTFKDFEKSQLFEKIIKEISLKQNNSEEDFFNLKNPEDVYTFLMFCSEGSDFKLDDSEYQLYNFEDFLFEGKKDLYKKYGEKILFDIKYKIISYN